MSLPFDVTIFKRCPKSRQVHVRINPLDLNGISGDFTRRPEGEQGLHLRHDMNLLLGPTRDEDRRLAAQTASSGGRDSD
jgi:hypothetical protein